MVITNRDDFLRLLGMGEHYVLGTADYFAGILTNQCSHAGQREYHQEFSRSVFNAIENMEWGMNEKTDIKPYIPAYTEDDDFEDVPIGRFSTQNIEVFDDCIEITTKDDTVNRCISGTTYANDKDYRTSYYFGGNVNLGGQNYLYLAECIEVLENNAWRKIRSYKPSMFVVYTIKTDKTVNTIQHTLALNVQEEGIAPKGKGKGKSKNQ